MTPYREVLDLLRKAQLASRRQKGRSLQKRDYAEKELLLSEAIRYFRDWLWIGLDPSEPGFYLIIGPKDAKSPVALHFPVRKVKRKKLARFIAELDDEQDRPVCQ